MKTNSGINHRQETYLLERLKQAKQKFSLPAESAEVKRARKIVVKFERMQSRASSRQQQYFREKREKVRTIILFSDLQTALKAVQQFEKECKK